ncbi:hypothetical protein D0N36_03495 [Hymenobacter lapidiphilus]|uniref:hypothetical protein n=1 Tax=Hymenobacter sp. CCM 8763 TaxID=2303334 RepID=UPI000E341566|nr:hypothetical protein [Hymenobacter sp. CCM 8763]RFP66423.1 hypothetical protein D0N36_03495 [Hymenobacter sp. CCM 8763]
MTTAAILREIQKLPLAEKLRVVENTLENIQAEKTSRLEKAAEALYHDYATDPELTAFTSLDKQPYHEAG